MASIEAIHARQILDSRGNPTLEVEVALDDGTIAKAGVPSGASTGAFEAVELRDGGSEYGGKGVGRAVQNVIDEIQPELLGHEVDDQRLIDQAMIDLDRTPDKSRLGANAIVGVSMAVARAGADQRPAVVPLPWRAERPCAARAADEHPQRRSARRQQRRHPGVHDHSHWRRHLQRGAALGSRDLPGAQVRHQAARPVDWDRRRGGLRPRPRAQPCGARSHRRGDRQSRVHPGEDIALAIDAAASEFYADGAYNFEGQPKTSAEMAAIYADWVDAYPIVSLEDPLAEEDWAGWQQLTASIGDRVQVVGDDLFVTNPERIRRGISAHAANSLLVKLNQIGSLTETLDAVSLAHRAGFSCVISHRSGETDDTTIADLAVATNCGQIKTGAPARGERVAKYNQLLRIEELLGDAANYAGVSAYPRFAAPAGRASPGLATVDVPASRVPPADPADQPGSGPRGGDLRDRAEPGLSRSGSTWLSASRSASSWRSSRPC